MIDTNDLKYFRKFLAENEVNEILGMYNVILNNPEKRIDLNELSKCLTSGLTTFDISDYKISVLALISIIYYMRHLVKDSQGIVAFAERYKRMFNALHKYMLTHARIEDLYAYMNYFGL